LSFVSEQEQLPEFLGQSGPAAGGTSASSNKPITTTMPKVTVTIVTLKPGAQMFSWSAISVQ